MSTASEIIVAMEATGCDQSIVTLREMRGFVEREQTLIETLLRWYHDDDGIADEMSWSEIQRQGRRLEDLDTLGIDPYDRSDRG